MPLIDMPLSELKIYQGSSPCPSDFEQFWETSLAELELVDFNLDMSPSKLQFPNTECFELYFDGTNEARIHAVVAKPKGDKITPAVVVFHGYSCNIGDWFNLLPYTACNMTVIAMDCRGQGGKSIDTGGIIGNTYHGHVVRGVEDCPQKLLFRNIFLDCVQLIKIVRTFDWVDKKRIGITGASQGGGLTLACAALAGEINCCASVFPFLSDYKRIWDMDLDIECYAELRDYFRKQDPLHETEEQFFERLGYIDIQNLASKISATVKMYVGLMDRTCPVSTQFAIYNKLNCSKSMVIYPDFAHENLPGCLDNILQFMIERLQP